MKPVEYTVICFNDSIKELIQHVFPRCHEIVERDLDLDLKLSYKLMDIPNLLKIDEDHDGIYDLRKTSQSDIELRNWGLNLCKTGDLSGSNIIMNPETRSGVSSTGTHWKNKNEVLVVGCFNISVENNPDKVIHCFLHEVGHSLGAKHTSNDLDSIMCYGRIDTLDYHQISIEQIKNNLMT